MSTKLYTKALVFFCALLAYSCSGVADAKSSSVIRSAHGLNKLNAASSSVSSINRHLRSSADTATNGNFISKIINTDLVQSVLKTASNFYEWLWRLGRKSSNNTFKDLKLHQTEGGPFASKQVSNWITHVESLYRESLDGAYKAMFSTLARQYKNPVDLTKVLMAGNNVESTKPVASKLLDIQIQHWIKKGQSSEQIFRLLELDTTKGGPLKSPVFMQWIAFVHLKYQNVPGDAIKSILSILRHQFETEAALTRALVAGKEIESTQFIASDLLDAQMWHWVVDNHRFAAQVFTILELNKTKDKLFEDPLFMYWVDFVKLECKNSRSTIEPNEAMFMTLKVYYSDKELAKVLAAGVKIPASKEIASELQKLYP